MCIDGRGHMAGYSCADETLDMLQQCAGGKRMPVVWMQWEGGTYLPSYDFPQDTLVSDLIRQGMTGDGLTQETALRIWRWDPSAGCSGPAGNKKGE